MLLEQPKIIQYIYKAPVLLVLLFGYFAVIKIAFSYDENALKITLSGFAIIATFSALSFSYARVIESEKLKDRLMFAGERFLHGGIFVITSSLIKYLSYQIIEYEFQYLKNFSEPIQFIFAGTESVVFFLLNVLIGVIFLTGILFSHTGLKVLNDLLLLRFTRRKDWDDML